MSSDEEHAETCGCWEGEGREPYARNVYVDLRRYGPCAHCGQYLGRDDSVVHQECADAFRESLYLAQFSA